MIPYSRQQITEEDIKVVADALRDDILTGGQKVSKFEEELAKYVGVKHSHFGPSRSISKPWRKGWR